MSEEKKTGIGEQPFEKSLARLEQIVSDMESGNLDLDTMIARFEEGQKLIAQCQKRLNEVERKVEILVRATDGSAATKEFSEEF